MTNVDVIERAVRIASVAHRSQVRKDGDMPYISHPVMVAIKLLKSGFDDDVVAAALVHDVLEDTEYPAIKLKEELGDNVFNMVKALTHDDSLSWEEKKVKYVESIRVSDDNVKAISIADKIHNAESLLVAYDERDKDVWKMFNRGRDKKIWFEREMLKVFKETWKHPLIDEYEKLIEEIESLDFDPSIS